MNKKSLGLTYSLFAALALSLLCLAIILLRYPGIGSARVAHIESVLVSSFFILAVAAFIAWRMRVATSQETADARTGIILGLVCGGAWILEISFNNFVDPVISTAHARFFVDNTVWALIYLITLVVSFLRTVRSGKIASAMRVGLWSGLSSGLLACVMGLLLVVVWMPYLLRDPLNIGEYAARGGAEQSSDMATYFAYETIFGAVGHLVLLGIGFGVALGILGGLLARLLIFFRRNPDAHAAIPNENRTNG